MAVLKMKDAKTMNKKERDEKLSELSFSLVKANVTANKASAKTKEIKRAIARLLSIHSVSPEEKGVEKK